MTSPDAPPCTNCAIVGLGQRSAFFLSGVLARRATFCWKIGGTCRRTSPAPVASLPQTRKEQFTGRSSDIVELVRRNGGYLHSISVVKTTKLHVNSIQAPRKVSSQGQFNVGRKRQSLPPASGFHLGRAFRVKQRNESSVDLNSLRASSPSRQPRRSGPSLALRRFFRGNRFPPR